MHVVRPAFRASKKISRRGLIEKRYPVYALADVTVESRDVQHNQMVNEVIRALAQWDGWEKKAAE